MRAVEGLVVVIGALACTECKPVESEAMGATASPTVHVDIAATTESATATAVTTPTPTATATVAPSVSTTAIDVDVTTSDAGARADENVEGWCLDGIEALDTETCVAIPESVRLPRTLVIYLHGVVNPFVSRNRDYQNIVAANAKSRGFVALMPRGRRGIGPGSAKWHWAWPTTTDVYPRLAKELTESWLDARARLEARLGEKFEKTFLAGSSNGAYFLTTLALKGHFLADGFAALSGGTGAGWTKRNLETTTRPPFYVGYGERDDTRVDPVALGKLLKDVGWPSKVVSHDFGHGARPAYLDEAVPFLGGP